jgi:hypothetical protein
MSFLIICCDHMGLCALQTNTIFLLSAAKVYVVTLFFNLENSIFLVLLCLFAL